MHNADYVPPTTSPSTVNTTQPNFVSGLRIQFAPTQMQSSIARSDVAANAGDVLKLSNLIAERVQRKEFFYGLELAARSYGPQATKLDYNNFGPLLPLFTSLIWFGLDYWNVPNMEEVESMRLAEVLRQQTIVMPHFTCYRTDERRLQQFLAQNFTNVLALRGDNVASGQEYNHASQLVAAMRQRRGDTISIGVGGYPDGHPDAASWEDDMQHLLEKVTAGADFIITQLCFSSAALDRFVRKCRQLGIRVPIVVGVFVPENFRMLQRITEVTKVPVPAQDWTEYERLRENATAFRKFAVNRAVALIEEIVLSDQLDVYGVQFFTSNKFKCVQRVLKHLRSSNDINDMTDSTND